VSLHLILQLRAGRLCNRGIGESKPRDAAARREGHGHGPPAQALAPMTGGVSSSQLRFLRFSLAGSSAPCAIKAVYP
jgi:hypothetical protein